MLCAFLCCLLLALLQRVGGHRYVTYHDGQVLLDNATLIQALEQRISELEWENAALRRALQAKERPPPAPGPCPQLQVTVRPWQRELSGVYHHIGTLRGHPHYVHAEGQFHLYYTAEAPGAVGQDLWVMCNMVDTAFRASVTSAADLPEAIDAEWKVWNNGWVGTRDVSIACTNPAPSGTVVHEGCVMGKVFEGLCYQFFETKETWQRAEQLCVAWGGHLASLHSRREEEFCAALAGAGSKFWFGVALVTGQPRPAQWTDGTAVAYTGWPMPRSPPAPSLRPSPERTGGTSMEKATWHTEPPDVKLPYVCKKAVRWKRKP
eukprot:EG_transcript_18350